MSAITGICDLRAISGSASASSWDGTATRTIWQPAAVSSAICCRVAFTSAVSVVVIDWTETGAPPPTGTACLPWPTITWRDGRRGASGSADIAGQAVASSGGWRYTVSDLLLILISINIFIGAVNLLPLLPLDGGHLAVIFYERIRAWLARLRGKPDPGLVDLQKLVPVSVGVFVLLIGLGVLLMAADIFNPVHLVQ